MYQCVVKEFPYLGSIITSDGEIDADVRMRIAKAANVFGCLKRLSLLTEAYHLMLYVLFTRQLF